MRKDVLDFESGSLPSGSSGRGTRRSSTRRRTPTRPRQSWPRGWDYGTADDIKADLAGIVLQGKEGNAQLFRGRWRRHCPWDHAIRDRPLDRAGPADHPGEGRGSDRRQLPGEVDRARWPHAGLGVSGSIGRLGAAQQGAEARRCSSALRVQPARPWHAGAGRHTRRSRRRRWPAPAPGRTTGPTWRARAAASSSTKSP